MEINQFEVLFLLCLPLCEISADFADFQPRSNASNITTLITQGYEKRQDVYTSFSFLRAFY